MVVDDNSPYKTYKISKKLKKNLKDYIRASSQYKQGQKGTQKDKAKMFYEHYKSCKKVMDQL